MTKPSLMWLSLAAAVLASCAVPKKREAVTLPKPEFKKTFGELRFLGNGALWLEYKNIKLAVDPAADLPDPRQVDYLLLTEAGDSRFPASSRAQFRNDTKIVAPESGSLSKQGFQAVKVIQPGQTIMLKKDDGFLFLEAVQSVGENIFNSYFFEFDGGSKIFVSGSLWDPDQFRPFLYGLRDEGKGIDILVLREALSPPDWDNAADVIALLQPEAVVIVESGLEKNRSLNRRRFEAGLIKRLYTGGILYAQAGESVPF